MTANEAKRQYRLKEWADRISERSKSGMTIKAWCAANNTNERVYHYWLRRVREYASQFMPAKPLTPDEPIEWALVETQKAPATQNISTRDRYPRESEGIAIEVGIFRMLVPREADTELITKVLRTLVSIC